MKNNYSFSLEKTNFPKVMKTLMGSIKKGIFYLGLNIPYERVEELILIKEKIKEDSHAQEYLGDLYDIFLLDCKIRHYDDILDNDLAKKIPETFSEMKNLISDFEKDMGENVGDVANLFKKELDLLQNGDGYSTEEMKTKIKEIIEIRPCDYFLLIEKMVDKFGTRLSPEDYKTSLTFLKEFQRVRDLLDDMMSIEEDLIKDDYNCINIGYKHKIPYHFFDVIVIEKFDVLKNCIKSLSQNSNKEFFYETVKFWEKEYEFLFKPLLTSFYINLEEFRAAYFMIKQT